jgi:hypothetical protein
VLDVQKALVPFGMGAFLMEGRYGRLLNWVVLIGGVAGIIYPAFIDERQGLTQILISLFDPKPTLGFAMRWLSVVLLIGAAYILIVSWAYRNLPISVIWTKLNVHFEAEDGSLVRIEREQALRANQPGVTAYFMNCRPTAPTGIVSGASIKGALYCDNKQYSDRIELHGNETRGFEVTHDFESPLPYAWYMPLIPMFLLNREPEQMMRWLKKKIVVRRLSVSYSNEFNIDRPSMNFHASVYSQHNISICIRRPEGQLPNLRVRRIKTNGVVDVSWRRQENHALIFVDRLQNETLRITWG